jgi:formylglycine-generating enzyme required for sulfatase activity
MEMYSENYYNISSKNDPKGADSGIDRTLRGGSWLSSEDGLRSANRFWSAAADICNRNGFRCVQDIVP